MDGSEPASARANLSMVPSWIMLGFILGILAVLGFQRERRSASADTLGAPPASAEHAPPAEPEKPARTVTALADRPSLAVIEAVFSEWGGYALWEDERTEVALWNSVTTDYTDFFEIMRTSSGYYFRSIPLLSRPWTDAKPPRESPLRFTEPLEQRQARLEGQLIRQVPTAGDRTGPWKTVPNVPQRRPDYLPPVPQKSTERDP